LISDIIEELNEVLNHATGFKSKNSDIDKLSKSTLKRIIKTEIGKTPMIIVNVEKV
jgi:hypothetical protein